ncbi:hypothetical protein [Sphingomonas sp. URHD0057]|uniref:hypothetical protein n=1 Tax=Sphingomonas sp. URHD0057 TaxID=1380389 RepID=UPI00048BE914|nr:hypothetical protein [Sphingomonas sp. URHD0057]
MSSAPSPDEIARDATWLAQALDPAAGVIRLIAMDRDSYRAASFLDDRMLQQPLDAQIVPWPDVEAAMAGDLRSDARWIFHIGHVGSTLVSRLLGELDNVLALREPRLLRDLALCPPDVRDRYLPPVGKLMSRTFAPTEVALVKATSFVSEIAAELVPAGEAALLMYATPRNYVASILAGENSTKELHALAPTRAQRLARRITAIRTPHNDAELAAVAWACEMSALETAAEAMSDRRVAWLDFDRMLADMPTALAASVELLQIPADAEELEAIAAGPLTTRYSKALEHDYSPALRRDLIADATRRFTSEVDGALAMLRAAAEKSPLLARSLARCGED